MYISRRLYQSHLFFHLSSVASTSHLFSCCVIPISSAATFNSVWLLPSSSFSIIFRYLFDSKFDLSCFLLLLLTFNSFDFDLFCLFFFFFKIYLAWIVFLPRSRILVFVLRYYCDSVKVITNKQTPQGKTKFGPNFKTKKKPPDPAVSSSCFLWIFRRGQREKKIARYR